MKKRIYPIASTTFSAIAVVLELLPWGAVLSFADPEGEAIMRTYSYFSLVPYGYANFAPLLCAVCSCVFLVMTVAAIFAERKGILAASVIFGGLALLLSAVSLFGGNLTPVSAGILISLGAAFSILFVVFRKKSK